MNTDQAKKKRRKMRKVKSAAALFLLSVMVASSVIWGLRFVGTTMTGSNVADVIYKRPADSVSIKPLAKATDGARPQAVQERNIALNFPYAVSGASSNFPDAGQLTDGAATSSGSRPEDDGTYVGFSKDAEFVMDFGQATRLSAVQLDYRVKASHDINTPRKIDCFVDDVLKATKEVGAGQGTYNGKIKLDLPDGTYGKKVKLSLTRNGTWLFLSEIKVLSDTSRKAGAKSADNPSFTVQYYGYVDRLDPTGEGLVELDVINTDRGHTGTNPSTAGGNIPENGKVLNIMKLPVLGTETNAKPKTKTQLVKLYRDFTYFYQDTAETVKGIDLLHYSENWGLTKIERNGVNQTPSTPLKNAKLSLNGAAGTIKIEQDTVLKLIYSPSSGTFTQDDTHFWDYDITDGTRQAIQFNGGRVRGTKVNSSNCGINKWNGDDNVARYAFGNANCGTKYGRREWQNGGINNQLNKHNSRADRTASGCTFNITNASLGSSNNLGGLRFNMSAPDIFAPITIPGAQYYFRDMPVTFARSGDAFTLQSAGNLGGLDYFKMTYRDQENITWDRSLFSNAFWPMEVRGNYPSGCPKDPKFGAYYTTIKGSKITKWWWGTGIKQTLPVSDGKTDAEMLDHNSFFGMHFNLKFKLPGSYIGPLDYFFYGDDDLWVYLDGRRICDIGGVHASVGQYVNLWDWLTPSDAREHTLSFYYTERGASGSSCYMSFHLPDVPNVPPGSLWIEKEEVDDNPDAQFTGRFSFNVKFDESDAKRYTVYDDYPNYYKTHTHGGPVTSGTILKEGTIVLKHHQYAIIRNIRASSKFTVTELDPAPSHELLDVTQDLIDTGREDQKTGPPNYEWENARSGFIKGDMTRRLHFRNKPIQGKLWIEKEVENVFNGSTNGDGTTFNDNNPFTFTVTFGTSGSYKYTLYKDYTASSPLADANIQSRNNTITSGGALQLTDKQFAVIDGIRRDTTYTVTEANLKGYITYHQSGVMNRDGTVKTALGSLETGSSVNSTILPISTGIRREHFRNVKKFTQVLPATGGPGMEVFPIIGLSMVIFSVFAPVVLRDGRRHGGSGKKPVRRKTPI